jgi:hypothetical protein
MFENDSIKRELLPFEKNGLLKVDFIFSEESECTLDDETNREVYLKALVEIFFRSLQTYKQIAQNNRKVSWRVEYVGKFVATSVQLLLSQGMEVIFTIMGTFYSPVAHATGQQCAKMLYEKPLHSSWERLDTLTKAICIHAQDEKEYGFFLANDIFFTIRLFLCLLYK